MSGLKTLEELETTIVACDEVVEFRCVFGAPDYFFLRVLVADYAAYEAFQTGKIIGIPGRRLRYVAQTVPLALSGLPVAMKKFPTK